MDSVKEIAGGLAFFALLGVIMYTLLLIGSGVLAP